jgi:DNA mismatch endonuclease (patch repair protein)
MADLFSKRIRSRIMSRIRGKHTKPEIILRKILSTEGIRYRLHYKIANKQIDIAFPSKRIAVFVDGCFWHGCPKHCKLPKSNRGYWLPKIKRNRERDKETTAMLKKGGWRVIRVWEHSIKSNPLRVSRKILHLF